jgi:tRNA A-37 threonylcarbamoyl transferase component Bud32/tetratricopeptide (TPR) repeat protein
VNTAPASLVAALRLSYRIDRELGQGGMATVYLAHDVKHDRRVAVKVLRPELAASLGPDRFLREIKIAAQLQHPHILPLLDSGGADGFLYYVMPYIEGESLRDRLTRKGELPVAEAIRLLRDVADALSYAHGRGVVHRDIKPDNVMLSGRHALVMDFGVAKAVSEATGRQTLTTIGVALGTPAYMAPEQAAADPNVDHRADIYAVGAMGYELLTGRPPFVGMTPQQVLAAHVTEAPKPVTDHRAACPPGLAELIMRALAKRPADRWQSADEMVERLESLSTPSGGTTPTQTQPTQAVRAGDPWHGHPLRVGALFLLVSAAIMGAVYFLTIQLGLPDWVPWVALALLATGLPIMIVTGLVERRRARALATGRQSVSAETGVQRHLTWKKTTRGGYLAFGALALVTLGYTAMRVLGIGPAGTLFGAGRLTDRDQLIVADFENRTPDSALAGSVTEAFRIDLAQSPVVRILPTAAVSAALTRMQKPAESRLTLPLARDVAVREGAKAVVAGEISAIGRSYVLIARIIDARNGAELLAIREAADDDAAIVAAIDRLSGKVRERIGESLRTIRAGAPLEQVTTGSLEALRLYSEGARLSDEGEIGKAIPVLRQAIALDTGFAMAWRKLAVALGNGFASMDQQVAAASRAYQHRDRLPVLERELATAYYHGVVNSDEAEEEAAYRRILANDPRNYIGLNNLSLLLTWMGRFAEAESLAAVGASDSVVPGNAYLQLLNAQLGLGKLDAARATLERLRKLGIAAPSYLRARALLATQAGSADSAERAWLDMGLQVRDPAYQSLMRNGLASVAQTHGRLAEADRQQRAAIALAEQRGLPGEALGVGAARAARVALFERDTGSALRILQSALLAHPLNSIPALDRPYDRVATAYAVAGRAAEARRLLAEYESVVPEGVRRGEARWYRARGWLALAEARPKDAVVEFGQIARKGLRAEWGHWESGVAYERANLPDSALAQYERAATPVGTGFKILEDPWARAPSLKRLGELYDARGDKARAIDNYSRFIALWKDADPLLQPAVREAKQRLGELAGETGRTAEKQ